MYTGATQLTNRVIDLAGTTGGGTLDASGTGPITFSSFGTPSGVGIKTLYLQGTNTGANTFSGAIVDGTSTTAIVKQGTGTWVLSNTNNAYTGGTTVLAGTLKLGAANVVTDDTELRISGSGVLDANNKGETVGAFNGNGTLTSATGSPTFNIGSGDKAGNFGGVIKDGTGSLAFTKQGTALVSLLGRNAFTRHSDPAERRDANGDPRRRQQRQRHPSDRLSTPITASSPGWAAP